MSRKKPVDTEIVITGAGMVSSLGLDIATSCATARAGILRITELDYFSSLSPDNFFDTPLGAHQVPLITNGFEGPIRLVRLLQAAFTDLKNRKEKEYHSSVPIGFYLSIPDPDRILSAINLIENREIRSWHEKKITADEPLEWDGHLANIILKDMVKLSNWRGAYSLQSSTISGHTGVIEAIISAKKDILKGRIETAIIGAADSFIEDDTLNWLDYRGRLKTQEMPVGLQPGEAGVLLRIEAIDSALRRGATILAKITGVGISAEPNPLISGEQSSGKGIVNTIVPLITSLGYEDKLPAWLFSDQNGECYRAMEWGIAATRLKAFFPSIETVELWLPAISFGETGAASGAVSICMAIKAFQRGYALSKTSIVTSSSDGPVRASLLIEQP